MHLQAVTEERLHNDPSSTWNSIRPLTAYKSLILLPADGAVAKRQRSAPGIAPPAGQVHGVLKPSVTFTSACEEISHLHEVLLSQQRFRRTVIIGRL